MEKVREVMEDMLDRGAQTLILGCTELPVAVDMYGLDYNTCDPTLMLARGAIEAAGGTVCDTLG
jgi:aspartate racemase